MDFISAVIICVVILLIFSLCGYCCKSQKEGAIFRNKKVDRINEMSSFTGLIVGICVGLTIFIVVAIITYFRRKRNSGSVLSTPVLVTTTTTTANSNTGYPVSVEPIPGGGYQATPYPAPIQMPMPMPTASIQPYPTHPGPVPMPMPQSVPYPANINCNANGAPYSPAGSLINQANPPSYEQVVAADSYAKQAPYNPNYSGTH